MPDEISFLKKMDFVAEVDLTREHTITEIVESYKKHRPLLDSSD